MVWLDESWELAHACNLKVVQQIVARFPGGSAGSHLSEETQLVSAALSEPLPGSSPALKIVFRKSSCLSVLREGGAV